MLKYVYPFATLLPCLVPLPPFRLGNLDALRCGFHGLSPQWVSLLTGYILRPIEHIHRWPLQQSQNRFLHRRLWTLDYALWL
ncbi:hypothetical protein BDP55DRAFT_678493 [Colletotrichum godetiae]|uniref:Uncharacterized protein n=1 Tax=Colletotrichum godetiae TaxID=1209918 RepID=A0AAJ0EST1_9PEZI|nr:uncharacterized protein BDP55DRAFT_678493 [Colletotrichum godetiae]KAK1659808.1 hypothetical protein BDP55DRAFT_678493 [Colletotrichum godetiae]